MSDRNEAEFISLINAHSGIIHKICRLYRDQPADREDLYQEIAFQLWKSFPGFKGSSKFSTWLYRIALNTAINTFRKNSTKLTFSDDLPDFADEQPDEELLLRRERLFRALQHLSDADKAIITLYLEDLSYQQIAEIIGINENYVGVKINRIKAKIQKLIL